MSDPPEPCDRLSGVGKAIFWNREKSFHNVLHRLWSKIFSLLWKRTTSVFQNSSYIQCLSYSYNIYTYTYSIYIPCHKLQFAPKVTCSHTLLMLIKFHKLVMYCPSLIMLLWCVPWKYPAVKIEEWKCLQSLLAWIGLVYIYVLLDTM